MCEKMVQKKSGKLGKGREKAIIVGEERREGLKEEKGKWRRKGCACWNLEVLERCDEMRRCWRQPRMMADWQWLDCGEAAYWLCELEGFKAENKPEDEKDEEKDKDKKGKRGYGKEGMREEPCKRD
jgi:hypothetical protein